MPNADRNAYLRAEPPARSRGRDMAIVVSMAIVSIAFGAGLLANGGFGFGPSLIGGLGLFVLLMFMHTMMRRLQAVAHGPEVETEDDAIALDRAGVVAEGRAAESEHGWGEPEAVNDLVRQLATELQKSPEAAQPPGSSRAAASSPIRAEATRPMPAPVRPLGPELSEPAIERAALHPTPARAPSPPPQLHRDDLAAVLQRAVESEDIEIHLQPVMSLADRRAQLYEAFPRLRDGKGGLIRPEIYARAAAEAGLLTNIDRIAFRRTVQILSRLMERGKQRPIFTGLSAGALRDGTFLRAFHETLKSGPGLAANLVFELAESDLARLGPAERDAIHALANAGFRFSLQDVVQLDMGAIGDLPIAFVKLLPIAISGQPGHAAGLVARIRSIGAEPVIDGVQDDRDISVAQALGIVLGQGSLLSEPRPLKADVVGEVRTGT